jgi:hypothetical protein
VLRWYSIIHTPPKRLPVVFTEFHRVLGPRGHLLLAFQVGDERVHLEQAYGHTVSLDAYRLSPDRIGELLNQAGLIVHARLLREPDENEKIQQAYLLARKPVESWVAVLLAGRRHTQVATEMDAVVRKIDLRRGLIEADELDGVPHPRVGAGGTCHSDLDAVKPPGIIEGGAGAQLPVGIQPWVRQSSGALAIELYLDIGLAFRFHRSAPLPE